MSIYGIAILSDLFFLRYYSVCQGKQKTFENFKVNSGFETISLKFIYSEFIKNIRPM